MTDTVPSNRNTAIRNVINERMRQCQELGYTPEHDDQWANGELPVAAQCYLLGTDSIPAELIDAVCWPFQHSHYKPENRLRDLTKAAALIVAEIERIMRIKDRTTKEEEN